MRRFEILIPVYNAVPELTECVRSVLRFTSPIHRILLLDDASTDPRMEGLLASLSNEHPRIVVRRSPVNRGFVKNVNAGLDECANDVILLNSDTLVSEGWIEGLVRALESRPGVGVVSPLFNDASFLSFPKIESVNRLPDGESLEDFSLRLGRRSPRAYPEIPAGIGCCMLITQAVLRAVGKLEVAFSPGYWEEIDYSLRARAAGFKVVCADDVYVYHHSGKSFSSEEKERLILRNREMIDRFWPGYFEELRAFIRSDPFRGHAKAMDLEPLQ